MVVLFKLSFFELVGAGEMISGMAILGYQTVCRLEFKGEDP